MSKKKLSLTNHFTLPSEDEMKARMWKFLPSAQLEKDFYDLLLEYATKEFQVFGFVTLYLVLVETFLASDAGKNYSLLYQEILRKSAPSAMTAFLRRGEETEAAIELLQEIEDKSRTWPSIQ